MFNFWPLNLNPFFIGFPSPKTATSDQKITILAILAAPSALFRFPLRRFSQFLARIGQSERSGRSGQSERSFSGPIRPENGNDRPKVATIVLWGSNKGRRGRKIAIIVAVFGPNRPLFRPKNCNSCNFWSTIAVFGPNRARIKKNSSDAGIAKIDFRKSIFANPSDPRGPSNQKIKSRSKLSISIKILNLARKFQSRRLDFTTKDRAAAGGLARKFQSRSKFSCSLEISKMFLIFGPSGIFGFSDRPCFSSFKTPRSWPKPRSAKKRLGLQ